MIQGDRGAAPPPEERACNRKPLTREQIIALIIEAREAIEAGDIRKADALLCQTLGGPAGGGPSEDRVRRPTGR